MKSILFCIISNRFESEIVSRVKNIMRHRIDNCDVHPVIIGSSVTPLDICKKCKEAHDAGYKRIYVQAATLSFSMELHLELQKKLEDLRQSEPQISLTIFPPLQLHDVCADIIERNVYHVSLTDTPFKDTPPDEIQARSFDFISRRLAGKYCDEDTKAIVVRVIHATADFSVEPLLVFSSDAVACGKAALKANCAIITDVGMVTAGLATRFKQRTICAINQPGVAECAAEKGLTRSAAAIELLAEKIEGAIIAVGNAPTALVHLLSVIKRTGVHPACIVGVPVGFVGAAESKELLMATDIPHISIKGNRGGTPIAVAAVNVMGDL